LRRGKLRELDELWSDVDGARIFYRTAQPPRTNASAPPLVLVHGWGVSSFYFIPLAERLAGEFAIYAPDLPGHGRSDTPPTADTIADQARTLLAWMDAIGLERATLIGHSMGSQIALQAALDAPARVERLVFMGLPDLQSWHAPEQFGRFALCGFFESPSLHLPLLRDLARMGARLVPEFRFMRDDPIRRKLPQITQRALLMHGEHDFMSPPRWNREAAQLSQADGVVEIPRWGHAFQFSAPDETIAELREFLHDAPAAVSRDR
jgi:pimeloyl-ACP methyl ester carboxylesterase